MLASKCSFRAESSCFQEKEEETLKRKKVLLAFWFFTLTNLLFCVDTKGVSFRVKLLQV